MRRDDGGGGSSGTLVGINIIEMQGLIKGLVDARSTLANTNAGIKGSCQRLWITCDTRGIESTVGWIDAQLPGLRLRLAKAEEIQASTPGFPNHIDVPESLLDTRTPEQAKADARRAADLLRKGPYDSADFYELQRLLAAGKSNPYFAYEFARSTHPRDYERYIRDLTPYESLRGDLPKAEYDAFLNSLAGTLSLATRGRGDLALPADWTKQYVQFMTMPPAGGTDWRQDRDDMAYRPALWLLLSRGRWSTDFLKAATKQLADMEAAGFNYWELGATWNAITPEGKRFMDPLVALMGALAQNPEAANWAFTQGGKTQVPFPKDGEGTYGDVQTFLYNLFAKHHFSDEEFGPATVLLAMKAAMMWNPDQSIIDSATNLKKSMEQQQQVWDEKPFWQKWGHTILDVLGFIPVIGEPADAVNAAWYGLEGDWVNAGLSAAALIPIAGIVATGGKLVSRLGHLADMLKMVDRLGNAIDAESDLAKLLMKGAIKIGDGEYRVLDAADLQKLLMGKHPNMVFQSEQLRFVTGADGSVEKVLVYVDGEWAPTDLSKLGLKLTPYKVGDSPWDMLGAPRGEVIEDALAHSAYRDWDHVGSLPGTSGLPKTYPYIDFYKDGTGISVKTMDATAKNPGADIGKNIQDLKNLRDAGKTFDGRPITDVHLDLRVKAGQENSEAVMRFVKMASAKGVPISVLVY